MSKAKTKAPKKQKNQKTTHLRKRTPLFGLSVKKLIVLAIIISSVTAALVYQSTRNAPPIETTDSTEKLDKPIEPKSTPKASPTETPATPVYSNQSDTPVNQPEDNASSNRPAPDAYGCTTESCRQARQKIVFMEQCDAKRDAASSAFRTVVDSAIATMDANIAQADEDIDNDPYQNPNSRASLKLQVRRNEVIAYNAKVAPAWDAYVSTLDALEAEGCARLQAWSNPAFPVP